MEKNGYLIIRYGNLRTCEKVLCVSTEYDLYQNITNCLMVNGVSRNAAVAQTEKILKDEDNMRLLSVYTDMEYIHEYGYVYSSEIENFGMRIEKYELGACLKY